CMLLAFWFVYLAARHGAGARTRADARAAGACAMLVLAGSVGLIVHAHEAVPELAALAASCAAFLFLFRAPRRPFAAGSAFGAALAVAFLSAGIVAPLALAAAALASHAVCDELRTRRAGGFLLPALALPALAAGVWALALWGRAPSTRPPGGTRRYARAATSARRCATTSSPRAGSRGRPGRSRCGPPGRCGASGAPRACSRRSPPRSRRSRRSPGRGRCATSTPRRCLRRLRSSQRRACRSFAAAPRPRSTGSGS
ncbi:MAG: hypothetical protein RML56_06805, partial [Burkholderiales bacterium]|nr:hypothetical protein [Burkholderiales bacterium]